jgi:mannose-6-phosphate isomerase
MATKLKLLQIDTNNKVEAIQIVGEYFIEQQFKITNLDVLKPWGFYFYFDPDQTKKFINTFFEGVKLDGIDTSLPLQPKVLVFQPNVLISWQYHDRRAEIWRCITKNCRVVMSETDEQPRPKTISFGDVVNYTRGLRHRGGGTDEWGAVAEIWQHADPNHPSDEEDVVRLQDDFGRN